MTRLPPVRRPLAAAAVLLAMASSLLVPPNGAHAATPQLRVAVDDGRAATSAGDSSVYTVTVTNLGSSRVQHLRLSQTVPTGARLVSAGTHGRLAKDQVTWTLDLPAAGTRTVRTTLKVDQTPDTLLRLATVACVRSRADGPPLVCAADSDELPAGAAAAEAARSSTAASTAGSGSAASAWPYAGAGVAVLLVGGAAVLLVRRRRRSLAAPGGVGRRSNLAG